MMIGVVPFWNNPDHKWNDVERNQLDVSFYIKAQMLCEKMLQREVDFIEFLLLRPQDNGVMINPNSLPQ